MSQIYDRRKHTNTPVTQKETAPAQPSFDALRSGAARPTQEQMGHQVDLPEAIRAKMENAFGADLSAVKLYESQTVADAGAKAFTRGTNIAFAPGLVDFSSYGGQSLLGHELSHVVTQARGEVTGGGFLNDYSLEARADREGAMAAAGRQIAMPTAAMSGVTAAAAAGPMQAKDKDKSGGAAAMDENIQISAPTGGRKMGESLPAKPSGPAPKPAEAEAPKAAVRHTPPKNAPPPPPTKADLPAKPSGPAPKPPAAEEAPKAAARHTPPKNAPPPPPTKAPTTRPRSNAIVSRAGAPKLSPAPTALTKSIADSAAGVNAAMAAIAAQQQEEEGDDDDNIFNDMLEQGDTITDYMSKANDPLGDLKEKGDKIKRIFMGPEKKSSDEHVVVDDALKLAVDGVEAPTALDKISQVGEVGNQTLSTLSSYKDVGASFAAYDEADKTGSHNARVNAAIDTGDALLNAASGTADLASKAAGTMVDAKHAAAITRAEELGAELTPERMKKLGLNADTLAKTQKAQGVVERADKASGILGAASGGVKTLKEAYNAYDAHRTKEAMAASMAEMDKRQGPRTEAEEEMYRTFNQSRRHQQIEQTSHTYKAVSNAIGTAGSVASLAGAGPVAETLLGAASAGVEKWGDMVTDYETDKFHEDTVNEATGIEEKMAAFRKDKRFAGMQISDKDLRRAILRQMGATSGEDDEMFQTVTEKRAKNVVDQARAGNKDALAYMGNARIDVDAEKANTGVESSLGLKEKKEFHDASALKYDEFEENAKKNKKWEEDTEFMTNGEKAKFFLKQQGQALGERFKTGGKKVAEGAKSAWSGLKKMGSKAREGLSNAGTGIKNFFTDPSARANALESLKTGAGKAVTGIGNGFKKLGTGIQNAGANAKKFATDIDYRKESMAKAREAMKYPGKVIQHAVNKKLDSVSDWYTKGVDQLNLNRKSYESMNAFDRAKWTMKNLPARLRAGSQKGREGTIKRYNAMINQDDAMKAYMGSPEEAPAEAPAAATAEAAAEAPAKKKRRPKLDLSL